ncbi:MAG: S-layer homology domain-containing protein, partial [Clostridia bacterium]|nr:S-layer homology domain-containing protein [Clostridia bacterium]
SVFGGQAKIDSTVTATDADKNYKIEGFAFDPNATENVLSATVIKPSASAGVTKLKLYYSADVIGEGKGDETNKSDGIPDKYQVTVLYKSETGGEIVGTEKEVLTIKDSNGNYLTTGNVTAGGSEVERERSKYRFDGWDASSDACKLVDKYEMKLEEFEIEGAEGGKTYTITAEFHKKSSGGGTVIEEPEVPEGLNGDDHFQYIMGNTKGEVKPLAKITRAEVAAIFYRLLADDTREYYFTTESDFPDLNETLWYNKAAATLANAGIFTGCDDGLFHGERNITRAELATVIAKFDDHVYLGEDLFNDISGHWGRAFINACADNGWIVGDGSGKFRPYDDITRAEVMTMINAVLNRAVDEEGLIDGYKVWPDNTPGTWYYYQVIEATNYHDYEYDRIVAEDWLEILPDKVWDEAAIK